MTRGNVYHTGLHCDAVWECSPCQSATSAHRIFPDLARSQFSSNVLSGFIDNVGGTWFNLNELHDEYQDSPGSVIAADFYHANVLLPMSDEEIVGKIMESLVACEPGFKGAKVEDYAVLR